MDMWFCRVTLPRTRCSAAASCALRAAWLCISSPVQQSATLWLTEPVKKAGESLHVVSIRSP